jgi:hypothetical protein
MAGRWCDACKREKSEIHKIKRKQMKIKQVRGKREWDSGIGGRERKWSGVWV